MFTEKLYPHWSGRYDVSKVLLNKRTKFQQMQVLETPAWGRMLVLDDITQTTELDEFIYHEMMVHVGMVAHGSCQRVLVIGGGDGGILREILKHPVEKAVQVEIDGEVVDACKQYMPKLNDGAYADKRTELIIADGAEYIRTTDESFDLVIVDSPDPVGPARVLFAPAFYRNILRVLRPRGLMVRQSGAPARQADELKYTVARIRKTFPHHGLFLAPVPTYMGGFFSFAVGAQTSSWRRTTRKRITDRIRKLRLKTKYYNADIHAACFALPTYIKELLK